MEKEEKIVIVLLIMALSSLSVAYFCFSSELDGIGSSAGARGQQYTPEAGVGDQVSLEAEVLSKRFTYTGEHLLLKVDCDSEVLTIFVPSEVGAKALEESINEGDLLSITGVVAEYEGEREIKVEAKEDISRVYSQ